LARGESINQSPETPTRKQTFEQFTRTWFDEYVRANNRPSEQQTKKYILSAWLVPFFGKMPIERITARDIERYKVQALHKVTNKSVNNQLTVLRKCLTMAYEWLALPGVPPKITWLKCPPPKIDFLSFEESELLLSKADGIVREMLLTALRTGMRQGEIRGLQWSSINWQTRIITVRHSRCDRAKALIPPKSNRERYIDMTADLCATLSSRREATGYVFLDRDGQPFDEKRLARRLAEVRKKARLRHFGWHKLRHTFASHLAMNGASLAAIQQLMGHAMITTTMRYAHLAPSILRATIALLEPHALTTNYGQPVGNLRVVTENNG
jgi:integrase